MKRPEFVRWGFRWDWAWTHPSIRSVGIGVLWFKGPDGLAGINFDLLLGTLVCDRYVDRGEWEAYLEYGNG